jgi:hypothetical protein
MRDGDAGFVGFASRLNPMTLPPGVLQRSENMRFDRGVAKVRKGAKRLANDISPSGTPLTVPFVLGDETTGPIVRSSYSGGIFSAAVMRSPDESNSVEMVVLAGPDRAYTYVTDGSLQFSSAWAGGVLAVDGNDNLTTDTGDELIVSLLPAELTYPTVPDETVEPTDRVSMVQAFDRLYLFREADVSQPGWETQYTNASGITVSTTTATVNVTSHGYTAGMRVRIEGSSASAAFDGHEYDIVTASTNSFTITVPSGTAPHAVANISVRRVKPPLYWTGNTSTNFVRSTAGIPDVGISYRRLRSAPWGSYINNRLIVPDGRQNVMLSDILDADTFDPYWQSFRAGVGGNDFVVAVHPWVDGTFLVFCRKSIWLATVSQIASVDGAATDIDAAVSKLELLTDEIGCSARRSIATAGQYVYFLSDSGVYRLDARLDLKLRGDTKPLSDPIADQIEALNADLVSESVGLYHDNRYYLAVPLAGTVAGDNNNGVFIYSQLNDAWETRDLYGFGVQSFIVQNIANRRRILISNRAGKLMLLDEIEAGDQSPDAEADVITAVPGLVTTRRYGFNSMSSKRFTRALADVVLPDTGSIGITAGLINPDSNMTLIPGQTNTSGLAEDYTLKCPIRKKANYAELTFTTSSGRPEIRNVSIEAAGPSDDPTETRHVA